MLPPVTDDVLRNEHLDHVSRVLAADTTNMVDERVGDLAVRGGNHLEGDVDVLLVPPLQQAVRDVGVDVDDDGLQEGRHGGLRELNGPHRRLVEVRDHDDRVHTRRQGAIGRTVELQLLGHRVVVLLDPRHEAIDNCHRDEREVGPMNELRRQDDDQDDARAHQANAVDDARVLPPAALLDRG